jgi:hypothetical protein
MKSIFCVPFYNDKYLTITAKHVEIGVKFLNMSTNYKHCAKCKCKVMLKTLSLMEVYKSSNYAQELITIWYSYYFVMASPYTCFKKSDIFTCLLK